MIGKIIEPLNLITSLKLCVVVAILGVLSTFLVFALISCLDLVSIPWVILLFLLYFIFLREFKGNFFEPIIFVIVEFTIYYIIASLVIISNNAYHHPHFGNETPLATKALFYILLALFFLYVGYKSNIGKNLAFKIPKLLPEWNTRRTIFLIILFLFIGFIAYYILIDLNGGFINFIYHIGNRARLVQGKGFLREAINLIGLALFASYILYQKSRKTIPRRLLLSILTLSYFSISLTLGGRGYVINILIILMFIHNYLVKRIRIKTLLLFVIIIFFFLNWAGKVRSTGGIESLDQLFEVSKERKRSVLKMMSRDFDAIDTFMAIIERVPEGSAGYQWGKTYLAGFLGLLPRVLYPKKPFGTAAEVHYWIYGDRFWHTWNLNVPQSASSITWIDELYINFSFIGVILGSFLKGVILRVYRTYLVRNVSNKSAIFICAGLFIPITSLSGDFFQSVIHFCPLVVSLFVFYLFVRRKVY